VLINVIDHFESLSVKLGLLDEEIGDWGLDVVVDHLLPLRASDCIVLGSDESFGIGAGRVRMAA
jgi:hypothetical protein